MNSLPVISHHLFVAAIASEGRANARPLRRDRPSVSAVVPDRTITLEVLDDRKPSPLGAARPLPAAVGHAGS